MRKDVQPNLVKDIEALNLQMLHIARELAIDNPTQAAMLFGLSEESVNRLATMGVESIRTLAVSHRLQFTPSLPEMLFEAVLGEAEAENEEGVRAIMDAAVLAAR